MRKLPSKHEIRQKAIEKSAWQQITAMGAEPITPEPYEMELQKTQRELMRADRAMMAEQERYLSEMASELNLKVLEKQAWKQLQRQRAGYRWHIRGLRSALGFSKPQPIPRVSLRMPLDIGSAIRGAPKPKPKKPKRHVARRSKTMRKLRKVKGVKVFSFPDHIWKVRK